MDRSTASDHALIAALRQGGQAADAALKDIYLHNRRQIGQLVLQNQGDQDAAKDIMQEAMIALYENVRSGRFKGQSSLSTYLYGIARLMWLNKLKRRKLESAKLEALSLEETVSFIPENERDAESLVAIERLLSQLGASCRQVLIDSIYWGYDMTVIARKMKFSNEQVARNKKHRCLKKLKELIKVRPDILNQLSPE